MKTIQRVFWAHVAVGVGALALGYGLAGQFWAALVFALLGALWFAGQRSGNRSLEGLMLLIFCAAAGIGFWTRVPGVALLVSVVGVLGAWDLDNFLRRLGSVGRVDFQSGLGREHMRRLVIIEGVGLVAGLVALTAQARIPFWWEGLLALLAVVGISRIIAFIRRQTED